MGSVLLAVGGLAAAETGVGAEEPPLRSVAGVDDPPWGLLAAALAAGMAGRPPDE